MSIGQTLREARERAGLSIEDISASTRIRATVISAIEADDFTRSGGDVYARGHIRSIAAVVGVDGAALIAEYDAAHAEPKPSVSEELEAEVAAARATGARGPSWTTAAAVVLVALIIYGVVQLVSSPQGGGGSTLARPTASPTRSAPATGGPTTSPSPTAPPTSSDVVAQRDSVTVVVDAARRASWIRVTGSSGQTLFEGLLTSGQRKEFTDRSQLSFVIGDAGAVDLTVNGAPVGSPGADGAVVRATFGPHDPASG